MPQSRETFPASNLAIVAMSAYFLGSGSVLRWRAQPDRPRRFSRAATHAVEGPVDVPIYACGFDDRRRESSASGTRTPRRRRSGTATLREIPRSRDTAGRFAAACLASLRYDFSPRRRLHILTMDLVTALGRTMPFAFASGINLYATIAVIGLTCAVRLGGPARSVPGLRPSRRHRRRAHALRGRVRRRQDSVDRFGVGRGAHRRPPDRRRAGRRHDTG